MIPMGNMPSFAGGIVPTVITLGVQGGGYSVIAGSTIAVTVNGFTAGRSLIASVSWISGATETISGITCTNESNLTVRGSPLYVAGPNEAIQFADLGLITASENKTITVTFTGSVAQRAISIMELIGANTPNIFHAVSNTSGSSTNPTGSITTTAPYCAVIARDIAQNSASSAGTGFTLIETPYGVLLGGDGLEYKTNGGGAGVIAVPFICSDNNPWGVQAIAYNMV